MKIAVYTDIHGNEEALEAILEDIQKRNIKDIYSLGDIIGIGPSSKECLEITLDNKVKNCLGNHEEYYKYGYGMFSYLTREEIEHHNWVHSTIPGRLGSEICQMPMNFDINTNKLLGLCHFPIDPTTGRFYRLSLYREYGTKYIKKGNEQYKKMFFGHNHLPEETDKRYINLPSSGCVHTNLTSYVIVDTDTLEYETITIPFDKEKLDAKIKEGYPLSYKYRKFFGA